ncbi:MAG: DUF4364 family protein [Bacillota bacterium]
MFQDNTEDVAKQKLLLLYILKASPEPLTKEQLAEILIENFTMNFFIIQQYISELTEGSFISIVERDHFSLLKLKESGSASLEYFKYKIPEDAISKVHIFFGLDSTGTEIPVQAEATSYPRDNGEINVNLKLIEKEETVFSMYISVPNQEQATLLMDKWNKTPELYFKSIIDLLISNKPTI